MMAKRYYPTFTSKVKVTGPDGKVRYEPATEFSSISDQAKDYRRLYRDRRMAGVKA